MAKRQTVQSWMIEALAETGQDGKACSAMTLLHQNGGALDEVDGVRFGGSPVDPAKLAERFMHKAEGRVQDAEGSQQFWVYAFYQDSQPGSKFPFRINVSSAEEHPGTTEPPNKDGLQMQTMRHLEVMFQTHTRQENSIIGHYERMLNRMAEYSERTSAENQELVGIFRTMMLEQLEKDHRRDMERLAFERATQERAMLMRLGPGLLNKVLGTELIPQSTIDSLNIEALAETLTPDQIQKLASILTPEQYAPLASRLADVMEKKRLLKEHESSSNGKS